jgi:DNA ligase-1
MTLTPPAWPMPTLSCTRRALGALASAAMLAGTGVGAGSAAAARRADPDEEPALLLARPWDARNDPSAFLVSEKLDGVRATWDGRALRHRSGRAVAAPSAFVARLPPVPLDGELWLGRSRFDALSAVVRRQTPDEAEWHGVRYMVFELPGGAGPFAARAAALERLCASVGWEQLQAVPQEPVTDRAALRRRLEAVRTQGGEGLMLHLAAAPWTTGRGDVLFKLKPWLDDEARVVGWRPGDGRNRGRVGALEVEMPSGRRFFLGSGLSDALRAAPPAPGSIVTYRYHGLTDTGLPRFASFLRLHVEP